MAAIDIQGTIYELVSFENLDRSDVTKPNLQAYSTPDGKQSLRVAQKVDYGMVSWFFPSWNDGFDLEQIRAVVQSALSELRQKHLPHHIAYDFYQGVSRLNGRIRRHNETNGSDLASLPIKMVFSQRDGAAISAPVPIRGISNPGNRCYFNAVLMAMCASIALRKLLAGQESHTALALRAVLYDLEKRGERPLAHSSDSVSRLIGLVSNYFSDSKKSLAFQGKNPFLYYRQQDAHEMATFLLDKAFDRSHLFHYRDIVQRRTQQFRNIFIPSVDCKTLDYPEAVIERDNILTINLPQQGKNFSLQTVFFGGVAFREKLETEPICHHERNHALTGDHIEALQKQDYISVFRRILLFDKIPAVLPIQLARFYSEYIFDKHGSVKGIRQKKNQMQVDVPYRLIVECHGKGRFEYVLKSAVLHLGATMRSGHYVAYIPDHKTIGESGRPRKWTRHSDSHTELVSRSKGIKEIQKSAYILFYDFKEYMRPIECQ